jgi:hypothetical protein
MEPGWTARIIAAFGTLAFAGGIWWFTEADPDSGPRTVVATSCSGFEVDAQTLFDKGEAVALSGTFAPGDHVRLAIDFNGVGYAWELTGVLATENVDTTGSGPFTSNKVTTTKYPTPAMTKSAARTTESHGDFSGSVTLTADIDVTAAGDGTIKIKKTSSLPSLAPPKVASARCSAA